MSYYFLAQIKINDEAEYQKYVDNTEPIFKKYKGEYLAVDNQTKVLEGEWDYTRFVIIRFNTQQDFEDWYHSAEYQKILKHRLKAAHCDSVLVQGLDFK